MPLKAKIFVGGIVNCEVEWWVRVGSWVGDLQGVGVCVFYHDTVCFACVRFGVFLFVWVFCSLWGMQQISAGFLGSPMFSEGGYVFVNCVCFDLCT